MVRREEWQDKWDTEEEGERIFTGERWSIVDACKRRGIPWMDIPAHLPTPEVVTLIPLEVARELRAVPLAMEEGVLTVAVATFDGCQSIDFLTEISGCQIFLVLSPLDQLKVALQRLETLWEGGSCEQPSREKDPI